MGEIKKFWGTPPNPRQERNLLYLFLKALSLEGRG
jgi:hypothetical protein